MLVIALGVEADLQLQPINNSNLCYFAVDPRLIPRPPAVLLGAFGFFFLPEASPESCFKEPATETSTGTNL
jgi:hypothetical protein